MADFAKILDTSPFYRPQDDDRITMARIAEVIHEPGRMHLRLENDHHITMKGTIAAMPGDVCIIHTDKVMIWEKRHVPATLHVWFDDKRAPKAIA